MELPIPFSPPDCFLSSMVSPQNGKKSNSMTPPTAPITPNTDIDIVSGRGGSIPYQTGNCLFRSLVQAHVSLFQKISRRPLRTLLAQRIQRIVSLYGGRFLQLVHGEWQPLAPRKAHAKVLQALRDRSAVETNHYFLQKDENKVAEYCQSLVALDAPTIKDSSSSQASITTCMTF